MRKLAASSMTIPLLLHAQMIVLAQVPPTPDGSGASVLMAFASRRVDGVLTASCRELSGRAVCSSLGIPQAKAAGLLICSCTGDTRAHVRSDGVLFSRRLGLNPLTIVRSETSWTVVTPDVKLLPKTSDQRGLLLGKLSKTQFALSPADTGSPFRIFVRRRDGKTASIADTASLKAALGVETEVETISIVNRGREF